MARWFGMLLVEKACTQIGRVRKFLPIERSRCTSPLFCDDVPSAVEPFAAVWGVGVTACDVDDLNWNIVGEERGEEKKKKERKTKRNKKTV